MHWVYEAMGGLIVVGVFVSQRLWWPYIMQTNAAGAPYVPMEPEVVNRVMDLAQVGPQDVFYELGSGDGRLVIAAAHKGAKSVGIEIDRWRVLWSRAWIRIWGLAKLARIEHKNFFEVNLAGATIVHTYLLEKTNQLLQDKLLHELRPGTKVISVGFKFPSWEPIKTDPRGTIYGPIRLYVIPPIV